MRRTLLCCLLLACTRVAQAQDTPDPITPPPIVEPSPPPIVEPPPVAPPPVAPQPVAQPPEKPHPRELNGHLFIPSNIVTDPFTATWFHSQTAFGYLRASAPERDANGNPTGDTRTISLAPLQLAFGLQIGVIPQYWSLRLNARGSVIAPVDKDGALEIGIQAGYGVQAGTTVSFRIGRFLRLGAAVDVSYDTGIQFNLDAALAKTLASGKLDVSTLLVTSKTTELVSTIAAAVGLHRSLGLVINTQYSHEWNRFEDTYSGNGGAFRLSTTLDFDLHAITPVPIGIVAAYTLSVPTSSSVASVDRSKVTHTFAGGVYYTGRKNFLLGPEIQTIAPPLADDIKLLFVYGVLTMRYYW